MHGTLKECEGINEMSGAKKSVEYACDAMLSLLPRQTPPRSRIFNKLVSDLSLHRVRLQWLRVALK